MSFWGKECKRLTSRPKRSITLIKSCSSSLTFMENAYRTKNGQAFIWHCRSKPRFHSSQSTKRSLCGAGRYRKSEGNTNCTTDSRRQISVLQHSVKFSNWIRQLLFSSPHFKPCCCFNSLDFQHGKQSQHFQLIMDSCSLILRLPAFSRKKCFPVKTCWIWTRHKYRFAIQIFFCCCWWVKICTKCLAWELPWKT